MTTKKKEASVDDLVGEVRAICARLAAIDLAYAHPKMTEERKSEYQHAEKQCNRRLKEIVSGRG